jgi:glycerol uptake facilitator-like aquaporin
VVSFVDAAFGGLRRREVAAYLPAQVAGCIAGVMAANLMFARAVVSISTKHRATPAHFLSEIVATLGLILFIFALARSGRSPCRPGGRRSIYRRGGVLAGRNTGDRTTGCLLGVQLFGKPLGSRPDGRPGLDQAGQPALRVAMGTGRESG